jgi:C4-type Zn-finger protein
MNYELNCEVCKRVIGFGSRKPYNGAEKKTTYLCIDCNFREQEKYYRKLKGENQK